MACTALIMIFWMSCVGTEVGNPQTIESEIDFDAYEHQDPRALTLESGISIDRAWLHIESIEWSKLYNYRSAKYKNIQQLTLEVVQQNMYSLARAPDYHLPQQR